MNKSPCVGSGLTPWIPATACELMAKRLASSGESRDFAARSCHAVKVSAGTSPTIPKFGRMSKLPCLQVTRACRDDIQKRLIEMHGSQLLN